jgi:hypothetical protein
MASAPAASASLVNSIACAVALAPAPPMTGIRPRAWATAIRISSRCSAVPYEARSSDKTAPPVVYQILVGGATSTVTILPGHAKGNPEYPAPARIYPVPIALSNPSILSSVASINPGGSPAAS